MSLKRKLENDGETKKMRQLQGLIFLLVILIRGAFSNWNLEDQKSMWVFSCGLGVVFLVIQQLITKNVNSF